MTTIRDNKAGFTLAESLVVLAIVGLLAALAIPCLMKSNMQSKGRRIVNDCRQQDAAIDQWSLETGQSYGNSVLSTSAAHYMRTTWNSTDLLGNSYAYGNVGASQVSISSRTKSTLQGVGINWGPY